MPQANTWNPTSSPKNETLIGHPGNEACLERAKELGVNSIAVGINWGEAEAVEGQWDFSSVQERVRHIISHGLLWVPQLHFTTSPPQWFFDKGLSVRQKCIEHNKENGFESIFNPNLRPHLPRFFQAVREHFKGELFEKVYHIELFACQYGEPNYFFIDRFGPVVPGWGGALHHGFQIGDDYAKAAFRNAMRQKYGGIDALNRAWNTSLASFDEVVFLVPEAEAADPKNDFSKSFDDETNTYRFDEHTALRLPLGRRWVDQVLWYQLAMNDYLEFITRTARETFGDMRLCSRLPGCSYLSWLGSFPSLNVKTIVKYGCEVRFTGAVHSYDQKCLTTATRFYRTGLWTEPMYAIGRQTGPTLMRGRRWWDAVFFGASCGQNITRSEYTNSFFVRRPLPQDAAPPTEPGARRRLEDNQPVDVVEENFPVYKAAVEASVIAQPFVRFATLLPTTQSRFGLDHRYLIGKLNVLLDYTDVDLVDEQLIEDGALNRYDAIFIRVGGLVEAQTIARLERYVRGGGLVAFGPRGILRTIEDPNAGKALLGLAADAQLAPGGPAKVAAATNPRLTAGRSFQAQALAPKVEGEILAAGSGGAAIWLRKLGQGAVLVCLGDEDDLIIPAFLGAAERMFGFTVPDGKADGILTTQLGEELLLFNRNDEARTVTVAGQSVSLQPYHEKTNPLALVKVPAPGPAIESVEMRQGAGACEVRVCASASAAGGYIEVRRPDYRTVYVDLKPAGRELFGRIETTRPGRYLAFIYLTDAKGRPTSLRRFEATIV